MNLIFANLYFFSVDGQEIRQEEATLGFEWGCDQGVHHTSPQAHSWSVSIQDY